MQIIYNIVLRAWDSLAKLLGSLMHGDSKTLQYFSGSANAIDYWEQRKGEEKSIWVHCASLGEFGVVRPIIKELKKRTNCRVVVTFFSPTGVNALTGRKPQEIDEVGYLPTDTLQNAKRMVEALQPKCVIWAVSEYWVNYLAELKKREIPTFLVGALMKGSEPHFKWYGGLWRKSLNAYTTIFALNDETQNRLEALGCKQVVRMGDPLFDNAINIAQLEYRNEIVEQFVGSSEVMVIGSLSDDNDLKMTAQLANNNPSQKMLIVPHEIDAPWLEKIKNSLDGHTKFYTQCSAQENWEGVQNLVIDYVGDLSKIYRYGRWAYIGGGFTPYLHSVIEASVYGIPVAFGPRIERKEAPKQMMQLGIGAMVKDGKELEDWWHKEQQPRRKNEVREKALAYTKQNSGATITIVEQIIAKI